MSFHAINNNAPEKLYKYLAKNRADVIENMKIRFTQPKELNDPFELYPQLQNFSPPKPPDSSIIDLGNGTYATRATVTAGTAILDTFKDINKLKEVIEFSNGIGVLSLSEVNNNLLMWSHYAGNHTGFVIGFNSNTDFVSSDISPTHNSVNPIKVDYQQARPQINRSAPVNLSMALPYLNKKSPDWAYEKEWRMVKLFADNGYADNSIISPNGKVVYRYNITPEAISDIIVGANADKTLMQRIASAVRNNPSLHHVNLYRAVCKFDKYDIDMYRKENTGTADQLRISLELNGLSSFGL